MSFRPGHEPRVHIGVWVSAKLPLEMLGMPFRVNFLRGYASCARSSVSRDEPLLLPYTLHERTWELLHTMLEVAAPIATCATQT